tara:strand:+ start:15844 stop:17355 length:1512 start_codon:yes stop_codon:yes gene_type:complete
MTVKIEPTDTLRENHLSWNQYLAMSSSRLICLLIGTSLFLTACVNHPNSAIELPMQVPTQWKHGESVGSTNTNFWWQAFNDSRLSALVLQAAGNNLTILQAEARSEQSRQQALIAGVETLPNINGVVERSRRNQNNAQFGTTTANAASALTNITDNASAVFQISWELDLWGKMATQTEAARQDFLASKENVTALQQSIAAQTTLAYFATIESREQMALSERTVTTLEETARQVGNRSDAGIASPADKQLAIANLETARAGLMSQRENNQRVITQLELLIRHYPHANIEVAERLPQLPPQPDTGIPAELLSRRPDLRAAKNSLEAAGLRANVADLAYLPTISLTGSSGTQSNALTDLLHGQFGVWSIAGQLVQPLFPFRGLQAASATAESIRLEALYRYAEVALAAFAEVENALATATFLQDRETALGLASAAAIEAERIALNRYNQGLTSFLNVLEAQQRALDTQSSFIAVRRARLDNRVNLHLALGGGFEPETETSYRGAQH